MEEGVKTSTCQLLHRLLQCGYVWVEVGKHKGNGRLSSIHDKHAQEASNIPFLTHTQSRHTKRGLRARASCFWWKRQTYFDVTHPCGTFPSYFCVEKRGNSTRPTTRSDIKKATELIIMADAFLRHQEVDKSSPGAPEYKTSAINSKRPLQKRDSGYLSPVTPELATPPSKTRSLHLGAQPPVRSQSTPAAVFQESCSEVSMPVPRQSSPEEQQQQQLPASAGRPMMKKKLAKQYSLPESNQTEVSKIYILLRCV